MRDGTDNDLTGSARKRSKGRNKAAAAAEAREVEKAKSPSQGTRSHRSDPNLLTSPRVLLTRTSLASGLGS
jgi:hypothetical protein